MQISAKIAKSFDTLNRIQFYIVQFYIFNFIYLLPKFMLLKSLLFNYLSIPLLLQLELCADLVLFAVLRFFDYILLKITFKISCTSLRQEKQLST